MKKDLFKEFLETQVSEENLCKTYKDYPYKVQKMLRNMYMCCYRLNLYKNQTIFVLNKALEPFAEDKEDKELLGL